MQVHKSNTIDSKKILLLPKGVIWEEVIKAFKEENSQLLLKTIDPATFKFILEENNHSKIIRSLLKTLKKIDSQHATKEYAEMTLGAIQKVVRMISGKTSKS